MLSRESHSYDILGEIGRGGMAAVAVARFKGGPGVFIPVVVKRILPELETTEDIKTMFLEEARTLSLIQHPNVVRVLETGTDMLEQPYIVFEYLHGEPLDALLRAVRTQGKRLPLEISLHIVAEVLAGLHAAHEARSFSGAQTNLVHRDVSPQNIFVGFDGWVRVIDFGIARTDERSTHTKEGILKGKIRYMSPEQCRQKPLTRSSDIFSVGVVLFELLTDTHPFSAASDFETMQKICGDVAPDPSEICRDIPESIAEICLTALEPDPTARFESALSMRRAVMEASAALAEEYASQPNEVLAKYTRRALPAQYERKEQLLGAIRSGSSVSIGRAVAPEHQTMTVKTMLPVERRRGSLRWIVAALAVLMAVALGVTAIPGVLSGRSENNNIRAQTQLEPTPEATTPTSTDNVTPAPSTITLAVGSEPKSSRVFLEGELLGTTPLRKKVLRDTAKQTVRVEADGHASFSQEIALDQNVALHISLRKQAKKRTKPRRRPKSRKSEASAPVWPVFE